MKRVGKYQIVETVKETFTDTIPKLLKDEDYLTGTTTREFEIVNKAPVSSMNVKKSKIADIVFTVGYAESEQYDKYMELIGGVKKKFEESGIEANVSTLKSSLLTAQDNFAWKEYDHINFKDRRVQCRLPKHIEYSDKDITMRGYSEVAYKDFLYVPDTNSDKKLFEFDMERDNDKTEEKLWHSIEGAGFLFNTEVSDEENYIQGYCVLLCNGYLGVYQINRSNLTSFRNGVNRRKLLVQKKVAHASQKHHWRIIVDKNIVTVLDGETVVIDQFAVPDDGIEAYGYGPITSHRSHGCEQQSYFTFHDIKMKTFSGESLRDLEGHKWTPGDNHYVINFNEDSVTELCNNDAIGDIATTLISNNASFYGIGKEKSIEQFNALINAIDGKGENISLSDVSDDSNQSVTLEMAFEHVVERMIADVNSKNYEIGDMISSDEKVEYTGTYQDFDGDEKGEEKWIYEYDSSVFASEKKETQILEYTNPIEMFVNTGAYTITHMVSDILDAKAENDDYKKLILSQHRPLAEIKVDISQNAKNRQLCNVNVQYSSMDEDHIDMANKGIKKEEFYYKQIDDSDWTVGRFPANVEMGTTYLIKYIVTDVEGTQSRPCVVAVKTSDAKKYEPINEKNAPKINLMVSKASVEIGEKFYVEASAEDDTGIASFEIKYGNDKISNDYGHFELISDKAGEYEIKPELFTVVR